MADPTTTTALVPSDDDETTALDRALPLPVYTGDQMVQSLTAYRELQRKLDAAMPDQIIKTGDRAFRKKGYWRAIRASFKLRMRCVEDRREVYDTFEDGRENFGWLVTYEATSPNGVTVPGDGACFAIDKAAKFRCPHPHPSWQGKSLHFPHETCPDFDAAYRFASPSSQATEHNVRSHAHTRAFNRAVSNLVAFGEVSAEEADVEQDDDTPDEQPASRPPQRTGTPSASTSRGPDLRPITEPQVKRLWAIASKANWQEHEVRSYLGMQGFEHAHDVTRDKYDAICEALDAGVDGTRKP